MEGLTVQPVESGDREPVRLELPQTPQTKDINLYNQLLPIYEAIRKLLAEIEFLLETGGKKGDKGDKGDPGTGDSSALSVPVFIPFGDKFTVPAGRQVLFSLPIDVEGILDIEGFLVEVD